MNDNRGIDGDNKGRMEGDGRGRIEGIMGSNMIYEGGIEDDRAYLEIA